MNRDKLNILHVVNISFVLPYFIGDQFNYFEDKGYNIHVACSSSDHLNRYSKEKNFKTCGINVSRKIDILNDIKAIYKLVKYIKKNKIDVVVGHTPKGGLLAMISAKIANVQIRVYFRHGLMYETAKGLKQLIFIYIEKLTGKLATKVVCVSDSVLRISNEFKLSSHNKNIILKNGTCNGIDALTKFNRSYINDDQRNELNFKLNLEEKDFVVGYVGRLAKDKGIEELIESWILLQTKYNYIKLLLVGPHDERDRINKKYIDIISKNDSIIMTGNVDNTNLYYSIMDIFILPSYREGFPTVVLEASAMSLPIITTKSTGCVDSIIENITGIYTDIDPHLISKSIEFYLSDPLSIKKHGNKGREHVLSNFQQELIWEDLLKIYSNE